MEDTTEVRDATLTSQRTERNALDDHIHVAGMRRERHVIS
jgi:hypothetical protein